jgi:hypothetical protein
MDIIFVNVIYIQVYNKYMFCSADIYNSEKTKPFVVNVEMVHGHAQRQTSETGETQFSSQILLLFVINCQAWSTPIANQTSQDLAK